MKVNWIDILLILFGLFLSYQVLLKILGGSWSTESIIIAFLFFNFGLLWKLNANFLKMDTKFEGHIIWHKFKDEK